MVLIEKRIPQDYLKQKTNSNGSPLQKAVLSGVVQILNGFNS